MSFDVPSFSKGFLDGVSLVLDQLEGRSVVAPQGAYTGPLPPELREWIDAVRDRVAVQQEVRA